MLAVRNIGLVAFLVSAAIATWLLGQPLPGGDAVSDAAASGPLGYYLTDAVLLGTDDEGRIFYRVHARQVEQSANELELELVQVRVEYRDSENVEWHVSADRAAAPTDGSHLDLYGNVRLVSMPQAGSTATVIETEKMRFEPAHYFASTDVPVVVAVGDNQLRAEGLKAYLKDDRVELESKVHGQFVP
jgi:lipopolysaccharide export system protein LptC